MIKHKLRETLIIFTLLLSGCVSESKVLPSEDKPSTLKDSKFSTRLVEDKRIYEHNKVEPLEHLYVTIVQSSDGTPTTFYDMNHWYDINSIKSSSPTMDVIVQEGTEEGPQKGDIIVQKDIPNSTIEIRGNTSRTAPQKSYKLRLLDSAGLWKGQKTINLNKHDFDITRVRNKLSFDYFSLIPDMTSLRTQFVHLHVKDLTANGQDKSFVDYGLYTHVEQVNERFLASRGLDSNGQLYKATNFEFFRYPEILKLKTDPSYNKNLFESVLEIKGNDDHTKLLKMLDDVNNTELNINDIFNKYFDKDNYLTWIAANIIFGNTDTNSQNFYLYSPLNSEKWYFLPWDYDGSWGWIDDGPSRRDSYQEWQSGVGLYWGVVLHKRFFKDSNNVNALNDKIEELSKIITPTQTKKFLNSYRPIVEPFIKKNPDLSYLPQRVEYFDIVFKKLPNFPTLNIKDYHDKLENPMPIFLSESKLGEGKYLFEWDYSFDLQGDELYYDFELSGDPYFKNIIRQQKNLQSTKTTIEGLVHGQYFWRIIVRDNKNNKQIPFDYYENEDGLTFNGIKQLIVR